MSHPGWLCHPAAWVKSRRHAGAIGLCFLLGGCPGFRQGPEPVRAMAGPAADPLNASYRIEDRVVELRDGEGLRPVAPGSAALARTSVVGKPVLGDLDGDGDQDALLWLVDTPGGSGSFVYLAATMREGDGYLGGSAVFVGDRLAPGALRIRNGVVLADYADRLPGQPMAARPTVPGTAYFTWEGQALRRWPEPVAAEQFLQGWLVIGHEVRTFRPCGEGQDLWLAGGSPALSELKAAYRAAAGSAPAYAPVFVSVMGRRTRPPGDGFGADYRVGFRVGAMLKAWPAGTCSR